MEPIKISLENFEREVKNSNVPVIVDFYANWCGPCKMMSTIIDEIAKEINGKAKVGKINVDENQELAIEYQVMSIPTIIIFKDGEESKRLVGLRDKKEILSEI